MGAMHVFSYISFLYCATCSLTYEHHSVQQTCGCGSPLLVHYDYQKLRRNWKRDSLKTRQYNLWRYHELLPILSDTNIVSFEESMTPLITLNQLGEAFGIKKLYMKNEAMSPTSTIKARGASIGVSKAKELGVNHIILSSNGHAGTAWTQYITRANIQSTIVLSNDSPKNIRQKLAISNANLTYVEGDICTAEQQIIQEIKANEQLYNTSTFHEPYQLEGIKTIGLEIAEQLNWEVPDVIICPTGNGGGLIGIYKAMLELKKTGWIYEDKLPRLVAVQLAECAPIVQAWEAGKTESSYATASTNTMAIGIHIPKSFGDFLILDAIYHTNGCAIEVSEAEILEELQKITRLEGMFICPEGAAAFSAAKRLRQENWIKKDETVVVLNTGSGMEYAIKNEANVLN